MLNLLDPPNGNTLAAVLQRELECAGGVEPGLSLAFLDLDAFTQFNADYGWERGTQVLNAIVSVLSEVPGQAAAGSIGGDAFAVVISRASANEAKHAIFHAFQMIVDVAQRSGICRSLIGVSIGGVTTTVRRTTSTMIREAHGRLIAAKRAGGGQVLWTTWREERTAPERWPDSDSAVTDLRPPGTHR